MLQCPKETFARLFYNVSSSFFLLLFFFHFTSIFLAKLFIFFGGNPFYQRNEEGYEFTVFSDEEVEEEEVESNEMYGDKSVEEKGHLGAVGVFNVESYDDTFVRSGYEPMSEEEVEAEEEQEEVEEEEDDDQSSEESSFGRQATIYSTPTALDKDEVFLEEILADSSSDSETNLIDPTSGFATGVTTSHIEANHDTRGDVRKQQQKTEVTFRQEEDFLVFQPSKSEGKKLVQEHEDGEIYGDTFTIGSTSKDSSEWRSSINCRDSGTDDPFSSSSRRSCPKWESYTLFQKYDEEMMFLDQISAQKLHETESLRSIQVCPRSFSERIVHKLRTRSKRSSEFRHNPYHELESAYVAQICLTWEALNWNFKYFQRLRASRREFDPGCPAYVAQQFQQFQVHLQRYIENEPYEYGRRPEIYARIRSLAPKLLQVPEYRDSDDEKREEGHVSRIPSSAFLIIMEESIRTFMNFLKQDKKSRYQILADLFKRNRKGSADATLLLLLKKVNKKKKAKVKELRQGRGPGKCLRRRRMTEALEVEILMGEIDLKVVSRVLRMAELNGEQLHWCENKMSKVRVCDGKLQRDSAPLFFPAH